MFVSTSSLNIMMSVYKIYTIFSCTLILLLKGMYFESFGNETIMDHYRRLRENLSADYDINARPVTYNSLTTLVHVDIDLFSIMDVDEEKQTFNIDCLMFLSWKDDHLTWNLKDFHNITYLYIPPNKIWKPDIYEMSTGGMQSSFVQNNLTNAIILYSGYVFWDIPASIIGRCQFDYSNYPSDVAKCKIVIENWTYRGGEVDFVLYSDKPFLEYFNNDNPYWSMKDCFSEKRVVNFSNQFLPIIEITFQLTRNQPIAQYQLQWVISVVVVLLTLCMFWIPADIRQKLTLGCVVMIMLTISLVSIASTVRVSEVAEITAKPIHITMFVVLMAIIFEIIVINLQYIQDYEPPEFILNIFSGSIAKILLINSVRSEDKPMDRINLYENQDELAPLQRLTKNENWQIIGQIIDRVLFVLYVLLLSSIPKTI